MRLASPLLLLVILLCSCAPDAEEPAPVPSTVATSTRVAQALWSVKYTPVGESRVTDDVVLTYAAEGDRLLLLAFDPHTGKQLWRRSAHPGMGAIGIDLQPQIHEYRGVTYTAFLAKLASNWQRVVVVNAVTGAELHLQKGTVWADSRPRFCDDAKGRPGVCLSGTIEPGEQPLSLRANLVQDAALGRDKSSGDSNARPLGDYVYATNDRPDDGGIEMLGYAQAGGPKWEVTYEGVFGKGASSDAGWAWNDEGTGDVIVGSGDVSYYRKFTVGFEIPWTSGAIVGVDRETGQLRWRFDSADTCPVFEHDAFDRDRGTAVVCHYTSGKTVLTSKNKDGSYKAAHRDVEATLVALDLDTGERQWSLPIGEPVFEALVNGRDWWFSSPDDVVVLGHGVDAVRVDLADGSARPLADDDPLVCAADRKDAELTIGDSTYDYSGGEKRYRCDTDGTKLKGWTAETVELAGESAGQVRIAGRPSGELFVIPTASGLSAFRVG